MDEGGEIFLSAGNTLPSWLEFSASGDGTGILSGAPLNEDVGEHDITLSVTDNEETVEQIFTITVENVNDAPIFTSEPVTAAIEDTGYSYSIESEDVDEGDELLITASTLPAWLELEDNGDGTGALFSTPVNDDVGDHAVVLRVTDSSGAFAVQSFFITVENVNDVPTIDLPEMLTFSEDGFLIEDFSQYIEDADGDILEITVSGNEEISVNIDGYTVSFTSSLNWFGSEQLTFFVEDDSGTSASDNVSVIVIPVNDTPIIDLPGNITFGEDEFFLDDFSQYVSDIDEDELTLTATGLENIIVSIDGFQVYIGADQDWNGNEVITFIVNDNQNRAIASDDIEIIVLPLEDPPAADAQEVTTNEDTPIEIILIGSDPDLNDEISFTVVTQPNNGTLLGEAPNLTFVPDENWYGSDLFTFCVSDGISSDEDTVSVIVFSVNDVPVLTEIGAQVTDEDAPLTIFLSAEDVENDEITLKNIFVL